MPEPRFAIVTAESARVVWRYLPDNYVVASFLLYQIGKSKYLIMGVDDAGWTLHDYVLPRLASGNITAEEINVEEALKFIHEARQ